MQNEAAVYAEAELEQVAHGCDAWRHKPRHDILSTSGHLSGLDSQGIYGGRSIVF